MPDSLTVKNILTGVISVIIVVITVMTILKLVEPKKNIQDETSSTNRTIAVESSANSSNQQFEISQQKQPRQ